MVVGTTDIMVVLTSDILLSGVYSNISLTHRCYHSIAT